MKVTKKQLRRIIKEEVARALHEQNTYTPERISSFILAKVKHDAELRLGHAVTQAVVTVPAYFDDAARTATKDAARLAGLLHDRAPEAVGVDLEQHQRLVDVGDTVEAGEQIGVVGNVPPSGGCHLDLRINVANNTNPEVATLVPSQNETRFSRPATLPEHQNFVDPEAFYALWGVELCPEGTCK